MNEVYKEILKTVISEINKKTQIENLSTDFFVKEGDFYVYNKFGREIYSNKLENAAYDLETILIFIEEVTFSVTSFNEIFCEEKPNWGLVKRYIEVDNKNYFSVLGYGDIFKFNFIKVREDFFEDEDKYFKYVNKIRRDLDGEKIRVVYFNGDEICSCRKGFYVDGIIQEAELKFPYISDYDYFYSKIKDINNVEDLNKILDYKTVTFLYSVTPVADVDYAYEYIRKLVNQ